MKTESNKNTNKIYILLVTVSGLFFKTSNAQSIQEQIQSRIEDHTAVKLQNSYVKQSDLMMQEIKIRENPNISFYVDSNNTLLSNMNSDNDNYQKSYLNGVVELRKSLYDFGVNDLSYKEESENKAVALLEKEQESETILYELLKSSLDIEFLNRKINHYAAIIQRLDNEIEIQKEKYKIGTGTVTNIREVQLAKFDKQNEISTLEGKKIDIQHSITSEFGFNEEQTLEIAQFAHWVLNKAVEGGEGFTCSENRQYQYSPNRTNALKKHYRNASNYSQERLTRQEKPTITGSVKGTAYDMVNGIKDYGISVNLNLSFTAFDGGTSELEKEKEKQSLTTTISQIDTKSTKNIIKFSQITTSCNQQHEISQILSAKQTELINKIDDEIFRATLVETNPVTKNQAHLELEKIKETLLDIDNRYQNNQLTFLLLQEKLTDAALLKTEYTGSVK